MRTHVTLLREALVLLLVGSGILFAVGSTVERHNRHTAPASATAESGSETHVESAHTGEAGVRVLGVDTESVAATIVGVAASLVLAAAVWLRPRRLVLLAVVVFACLFAVGDVREFVHQLNESNNGIAAVAALLLVFHLAVAALAAVAVARRGGPTPVGLRQSAG